MKNDSSISFVNIDTKFIKIISVQKPTVHYKVMYHVQVVLIPRM